MSETEDEASAICRLHEMLAEARAETEAAIDLIVEGGLELGLRMMFAKDPYQGARAAIKHMVQQRLPPKNYATVDADDPFNAGERV